MGLGFLIFGEAPPLGMIETKGILPRHQCDASRMACGHRVTVVKLHPVGSQFVETGCRVRFSAVTAKHFLTDIVGEDE